MFPGALSSMVEKKPLKDTKFLVLKTFLPEIPSYRRSLISNEEQREWHLDLRDESVNKAMNLPKWKLHRERKSWQGRVDCMCSFVDYQAAILNDRLSSHKTLKEIFNNIDLRTECKHWDTSNLQSRRRFPEQKSRVERICPVNDWRRRFHLFYNNCLII